MKNTACIILAAGKGERMKSDLPKVLHPLCSRPMLLYVLDLVKTMRLSPAVAVLGFKYREVQKIMPAGVRVAVQKKQSGTADAVKAALDSLKSFRGTVLVLYGDNPLIKKETIKKLLSQHIKNGVDVTLLTAEMSDPQGYGRIWRDKYGAVSNIIEEKDALEFQKKIKEINTGIMCFKKESLVEALKQVRPNNRKKEYYLTDTISIIYQKGGFIESMKLAQSEEAMGINSRVELAKANKIISRRLNEAFMKNGVSLVDPETAYISFGAKIGRESVIYPFTVIEKDVTIGSRCSIGPFIHLREGTRIADDVVAGNFLETVRSKISPKTFIKHFSYIGDTDIGRAVNIGAGTVIANFDGKNKHNTLIKDNAFIGSDSVLVAPVTIGKRACTGAGSVVTKNTRVPDGAVMAGVPARKIR